MTVSELIIQLRQYPQGALIVLGIEDIRSGVTAVDGDVVDPHECEYVTILGRSD